MCRCQPISALTSKVHQTTTPNMQRRQTCLTRATSSTPAFQWHFHVARQPWSIFACMNSSREKRVRLLRRVRSASSTKHCGRAAETFATLLSQPLTRLWHRDVLGLPVPSMFGGIVTGGSGVTRINRGAYLLGSLRHGRLATKHRGVHLPA